jgi:hypothetical protein
VLVRLGCVGFEPYRAEAVSCGQALEVAIAEAVQPVADFRFVLEVMQAPYSAAHAWSDYRAGRPSRPHRDTCAVQSAR